MIDLFPVDRLVLALFGPTASGKSEVAAALAERTAGEVVSADAMQAYRGLPILTNQPTRPTHLVGIWPLFHEGSVGEYAGLAHAAVDELLGGGRTPIVAGGTGLYLRAAIAELELPSAAEPETRRSIEHLYDEAGPAVTHLRLASLDATAAAAVHPNDRKRVVRALELAERGGSLAPARDRLWSEETRHPTLVFGLHLERGRLDERIRARTRRMFERGVEEEVRTALAGPVSPAARKALGLDEVAELPRERAVEAIVTRTSRYAAYQRKWMRRIPGLLTVDGERSPELIADEIIMHLHRRLGSAAPGKARIP